METEDDGVGDGHGARTSGRLEASKEPQQFESSGKLQAANIPRCMKSICLHPLRGGDVELQNFKSDKKTVCRWREQIHSPPLEGDTAGHRLEEKTGRQMQLDRSGGAETPAERRCEEECVQTDVSGVFTDRADSSVCTQTQTAQRRPGRPQVQRNKGQA